MKKILAFVFCIVLVCGTLDAQNLLKKLGKAVKKEVTEKVSKEVENVLNGKSTKNPQQSQQPVSGTSQIQEKLVVTDYGENIPRQDGLDYIDEYGINHGGGILIDTVLWAPVNCGYHETDYPYGKLYQWGRKHGQGYGAPFEREEYNLKPDKTTAVIVPAPVTPQEALKHPDNFYARSEYSSFNWTKNDTKLWNSSTDDGYIFKNKDYDPCPEGWRLPDLHDFYCLAQNFSEEVVHPETGQKGRWLSGSQPYGTEVPRIFLPLAGSRGIDGGSSYRDNTGAYWSNRHGGGEGLVWYLIVSSDKVEPYPFAYPHEAMSVRCVKDREGQRMR